jgi:predicted Zn-dependent protease
MDKRDGDEKGYRPSPYLISFFLDSESGDKPISNRIHGTKGCIQGLIIMKRWFRVFLSVFLVFSSFLIFSPIGKSAVEFKKGTLLRDAEIERILKSYMAPLFKTAGLNPATLKIILIFDSELNAFATTHYTIALYTGLLQKVSSVGELIGVLAHETGHIAGGHIVHREAAMRKSNLMSMTAAALGLLVGIATGRGDLGSAIIMGGADTSYKNVLHYTRGQEASADQAAVRLLNALQWPAQGLVAFMDILSQQELLSADQQDPYLRTHPFSSDRVTFLKHSLKPTAHNYTFPHSFQQSFRILKAKIDGFLNPPGQTLLKYSEKDPSFEARYARAIAFYRNNQTEHALALLEQLIQENPSHPYTYELKGQILYENGRMTDAITALEKACQHAPDEALITLLLVQCLLETQHSVHLQRALTLLKKAQKKEDDNPILWHLMAMVYGRQKNVGMAALSLAEKELRLGHFKLAHDQAKRALMHLQDPQARLRAHDILRHAEEEKHNEDHSFENEFIGSSQN